MANLWRRNESTAQSDKVASEDRLIMLCDGIFAIAVTLLVLDIRLPTDANHFQENLHEFFIKILFYFVTFVIIARYWMQHRDIMHQVLRLDKFFIWLTFLFLAFVGLFPVTITVLNEFGDHYEAVIIYVVSLAACGLSASFLWIYASWKHRLIDPDVDQNLIHFRTINTLLNPIYFLLSLLLLFIPLFEQDPPLIFFSWVFISVPNNIVQRLYPRWLAGRTHQVEAPGKMKTEMVTGGSINDEAAPSAPSMEEEAARKKTSVAVEEPIVEKHG